MANAIDVADFIIQESAQKRHPVSNLELQKYMYFCHARSLVEGQGPLIEDEPLQKWKHGPVSPTVYHTYKRYGIDPIFEPDSHTSLNTDTWEIESQNFDISRLTDSEIDIIRKTIPTLFKYGRFELVEETHRHPSWANMERDIINGSHELTYSNEEIISDFQHNGDFQIWLNS